MALVAAIPRPGPRVIPEGDAVTRPIHSIIIPHRDRQDHLADLFRSLAWAWDHCDLKDRLDVEVIVAHAGEPRQIASLVSLIPDCIPGRIVAWSAPMPIFNKARMLNLGYYHAHGDLVTFLDADAILGPRFLNAAGMLLDDPGLVRVCYRVHHLPADWTWDGDPRELLALFTAYDSFPRGYFGRGTPWRNHPPLKTEVDRVFGNSQGTVRRKDLGDIIHEEAYQGRGFEDLHFLMDLWDHYGDRYRGAAPDDPAANLLLVRHRYRADWDCPESMTQNLAIFRARKLISKRDHW